MDNGANVNIKNKLMETCLIYAIEGRYYEIVKLLLEKHGTIININETNHAKNSCLMLAVMRNDIRIVQILLEYGANSNAVDEFGKSSLALACANGSTNIVKLLLEKGTNVNVDNNGETCLMQAIKNANVEIVKILLEKGADAEIINIKGQKASDMTANYTILRLLGAKTIEQLLNDGNFREVARKYEIIFFQTTATLSDCPICFDSTNCVTDCGHHYCLECYLFIFETKKCCVCSAAFTNNLFVY